MDPKDIEIEKLRTTIGDKEKEIIRMKVDKDTLYAEKSAMRTAYENAIEILADKLRS